jgi:hypothetical protein
MLSSQAPSVLKKLLSTFLCLCSVGVALALDKPATPVAPAAQTKDVGDEANRRVAAETGTAIKALGEHPATKQISNIVFKAIRSAPAGVLLIVHTAAQASPAAAVPEIVAAATAAVPNPWKKVTYRRLTALDLKKSEPDFKGGPDGKQMADGKGVSPPDGRTTTLAEAIAFTAFNAQPGLSLPALQAAVDTALLADPATLLRYIQSPSTLSGVGDAGTSNYANEPLRTPTVSGTTPVPTPQQPTVSQ